MKYLTPLLLPAVLYAQDRPADRQAIEQVLTAFNAAHTAHDAKALDRLFVSGGDIRTASGAATAAQIVAHPAMWSEVTTPQVRQPHIRFLSGDVALVDAFAMQYGSMILKRSVPVVFVMQKQGADWRIAAYRVLGPCPVPSRHSQ